MQLKTIILYNAQGQKRFLKFYPNRVNIITGRSKAGKSSIINIIDYCLGRSTFQVAAGVITDTVEWYAVVYQVGEFEIMIAKPKPAFGQVRQSEAYLQIASQVDIPELSELMLNSNDEAITNELSRRIGITPNRNIPPEGQTREPLEATIAHAKLLLFQPQSVIANREVLFYRQAEPFMAQAIKDTLPYFLGIVQEDRLRLLRVLQDKRRDARILRRQLQEAETAIDQRVDRGRSLIVEAQQVGLISQNLDVSMVIDVNEILAPVRAWQPTIIPLVPEDKLSHQQDELEQLRREFNEKQYEIESAEKYVNYATAFIGEASEQTLRLESINLFEPNGSSSNVCPLCGTSHDLALVSVEAITRSLESLHNQVSYVARERPEIDEYIRTLRGELEGIRQRIQQKEFDVQVLLEEQAAASNFRDTNARIARVVGRISYFLDVTPASLDDETLELRNWIAQLEREIKILEAQLDTRALEDRTASVLNIIGADMTRLAELLELEHKAPYRLDLNKLTVIADRPEGAIVMNQNMGSAANHLGSHLVALLALHSYFIRQQRPVPSFLILDQPTQVYFPPERYAAMEGNENELNDEDRLAVDRMFRVLFEVSAATGLQIVVLEHANLNTDEFQNSIIDQVWRGDNALIPVDWL